jgi:hypothetical protein
MSSIRTKQLLVQHGSHKQNTRDISEVPDFIDLDRRELLLHFHKEPEGNYKDITETEGLHEAQK